MGVGALLLLLVEGGVMLTGSYASVLGSILIGTSAGTTCCV
jgi:hypothetical protein